MPKFNQHCQDIIEIGRRMYKRGFISGTDGNLSVLRENGDISITSSGVSKGFLSNRHIVEINRQGELKEGDLRPSSESGMHLFVYRNRSDIFACCHAHPPYATVAAITGRELPYDILPEIVLSVGKIAMCDYASPGTEQVGESLKPYISNRNAFVLANHGVLTIGPDIITAYNRMETVEHLAKIIYIASQGDGQEAIKRLDENELKRLEKL